MKPTVAEALGDPDNLTWRLGSYDPDFPTFSLDDVLDCTEDIPELEAVRRWGMVLHNQYPWDRSRTELVAVSDLTDDDFVVTFHPRNREVSQFLRRVRAAPTQDKQATAPRRPETRQPIKPYEPIDVRRRFAVLPRFEALAMVKGEQRCTNEDLIRNTAYNWSPMSADDIRNKTGIEQRSYTLRSLEEMGYEAAAAALAHAGRGAEEIGAVIFCTCTSTRLIPSLATWLSGELGIFQTQASCDIVAACAGFPYGLAEATRQLQDVRRPVLLICAEKFSDKIGTVRPSRMILADAAAAMVIAPAAAGSASDIEFFQTYASGPRSEVNSIIWPNPAFDNNISIYGPEVRALAGRYLEQMIGELEALPHPDGGDGTLVEGIDLVVPHQANRTMVIELAAKAGLTEDRLYFNIDKVGNTSSASIPVAIWDAIDEGVIAEASRVFCPAFGAGAVGGYGVIRVDPAIAAPRTHHAEDAREADSTESPAPIARISASEEVAAAFG